MADAILLAYAILLVGGAGYALGERHGRAAEMGARVTEVSLGRVILECMDCVVQTRTFVGDGFAVSRRVKFNRLSDGRCFEVVISEDDAA